MQLNVNYCSYTFHIHHRLSNSLPLCLYLYNIQSLLSAIAGPPLQEIRDQIQAMIADSHVNINAEKKKPFVIYSCHDVTVLSLLYGIGADFLAANDELIEVGLNPGNDERWRFWPRYASTLVFELVRLKDSDSERFVRILLNGKEVIPISALRKEQNMLSISDFTELIDNLMKKSVEAKEVELDGERDMSNWTG